MGSAQSLSRDNKSSLLKGKMFFTTEVRSDKDKDIYNGLSPKKVKKGK
jgi:hypothetical protein